MIASMLSAIARRRLLACAREALPRCDHTVVVDEMERIVLVSSFVDDTARISLTTHWLLDDIDEPGLPVLIRERIARAVNAWDLERRKLRQVRRRVR